MISEGSCDTEG